MKIKTVLPSIALAGIQALVDENRALQARIEQLEQLVSRMLQED